MYDKIIINLNLKQYIKYINQFLLNSSFEIFHKIIFLDLLTILT